MNRKGSDTKRSRRPKKQLTFSRWIWRVFLLGVFLFVTAPSVIIVFSSFSETQYLTFPPQGFTLKWYEKFMRSSAFMSAFRLSLVLAIASVAFAMVIGSMAAVALDRYRFPGRDQLQLLFLSPLVVPMIVLGIAMLQFFARLGIRRGFDLLLLGHLIITTPYVTRTMVASLAGFDRSLEEAAMNLGASPLRAFWKITLPNIRAGLVGSAIFAFITSFGNLTLSIFIAGPRETTLPVRLFSYIEFAYDPIITTISTVITVVTIGALLILSRVTSLDRLF